MKKQLLSLHGLARIAKVTWAIVVDQVVTVYESAIPLAGQNISREAAPSRLNLRIIDRVPWLESVIPENFQLIEGPEVVTQKMFYFPVSSASALITMATVSIESTSGK